ncbi:MAG TPA: T9SS type A sorting domain-containing protein [Candidatus Kapabacteria bacterium]|nr:T9SS type A sorting domain-containing protein [Candidatus Kapabacteria bacterium]
MKRTFLLSILFLMSYMNGITADLEYPQVVDEGGVNVRLANYIYEGQIQSQSYKSTFIKIKNISQEIIYIYSYKEETNYTKEIKQQGNYIYTLPFYFKCLYPNDSLLIRTYFYANYLDSISLSGEKLISDLTVFYRNSSSRDFDSITIRRQFFAYSKEEVLFSPEKVNSTTFFGTVDTISFNTTGYLTNLTVEPFIIDSIKYSFIGNNFKQFRARANGNDITYPYELDTMKRILLSATLKLSSLDPEFNKFPVTIYGHLKESNNNFVLSDTLIFTLILDNKLKLSLSNPYKYDRYPLVYGKVNDTISIINVSAKNSSLTKWNLISIIYEAKNREDVIDEKKLLLPATIEQDSSLGISIIKYYCRYSGKDTILLSYDFENDIGEKIHHTAIVYVDVSPGTSVINNDSFVDEPIVIYPNPIEYSNVINIILDSDKSSEIKLSIYNLIGTLVEEVDNILMTQGQFQYIIKNNLPIGTYFLMVKDGNKRWVKQFQIIQ